jgi:hypothetical protein
VRTLIDISPGVTLQLDLDDAERSWVAQAVATPRCDACKHHPNAHVRSGCNVEVDKRKCGCARAVKRDA